MELLYATCIRASELIGLQVKHIDNRADLILVLGKG
ncbi:hypothetical protein [Geomicrobium sp. JCM 19039]